MSIITKELITSEKFQSLQQTLQENLSILAEELWNAPKALLISFAQQITGKHVLVLTGASQEEVQLFHDFSFFTERLVLDFPAWETMPSEEISPSSDIVGERYKVLEQISSAKQPLIILSGLQACLQKLIPPEQFSSLYVQVKKGEEIGFDFFIEQLLEMGYQRQPVAADKGEFAVRGGIIDVYPVSSPDPFRLEFWGEEVASIRIYDPVGQKSIKSVETAEIPPAQELELIKKTSKLCSILDYLGPNTIVVFDDLLALEDRYANLINFATKSGSQTFSTIEEFLNQALPLQKIFFSQTPIEELSEVQVKEKTNVYSALTHTYTINFSLFNRSLQAKCWRHPFIPLSDFLLPEIPENQAISGEEIFHSLSKLSTLNGELHFLCVTELEETNLLKRIQEAKIQLPKKTHYHIGYLSSGFVIKDVNTVVVPLTEITHRYKIRRQKLRSTYHSTPVEMFDLIPGETVVHFNHGIGKYLGLEKRPNNAGVISEFFLIEYADKAKLYVPMNQAHLISKYIGSDEGLPKLHELGGSRWKKTKENTQKAILGYAKELLEMYANRAMKGGFAFPEDSLDMKAFEEDFPFVETEDQLQAVADIKKDMVQEKSMDRLICGDVGYGKTEVAMRAAFKAVCDGKKQVAVLVPTTVLAMQHYENFCDRMSNFAINVGVLSRFRTAKEIRDTLKGVEEGTIDIVIGTHRIISQDVKFKDLGLVIVDEEQRFGVKAKEHLKKIKTGVDCLTLSATPIPRTLYMSLIGARDMSVINTPPQDRLPIKTILTEPAEQVIKNAILRELSRDGQVYIIHNRVETIYDLASKIKELVPHARVLVGHGQMHADEIDMVFHTFKKGQADILIATTIVENGIDIPNANTILIDRADHFGIADLYQLCGRVGRWNRQAYAYLLAFLHRMSEISMKRLLAFVESRGGYGGGMRVAMQDLRLRGAGNILGEEQSGHVSAIGFHLYCKMLKRTILTMQGQIPALLAETRIEIPIDARLPESYVNEMSLRMEVYQRLGECLSFNEIDLIFEELKDRFGPLPEPALWLYHQTRIKVYASQKGYTLIKLEKNSLLIELPKEKDVLIKKVQFILPKNPREFEEKLIKELI